MFYQKILPASAPYNLAVTHSQSSRAFPMHKHYEIELHYCDEGSLTFRLSDEEISISSGEMIIIGSMIPHEVVGKEIGRVSLFVEIGPAFLGEHFNDLVNLDLSSPVLSAEEISENSALKSVISDLMRTYGERSSVSKMKCVGLIWQLASEIAKIKCAYSSLSDKRKAQKIEPVINYIHAHYTEEISLEDAMAIIGYSKGSFCKMFKDAMGMGFHQYLNNYRIQSSLYLLKNTDMAIGEIAETVGFSEFKSFCRVFKSIMGETPGEFRK